MTELSHYGVKGMKWGVRRDRKSSGKSKKKKTLTPEQKAKQKIKDAKIKAKEKATKAKLDAKVERQMNKIKGKEEKALQKIADKTEAKKPLPPGGITRPDKPTREMSLQELRDFNNRYEAEKRYNQAVEEIRSSTFKAKAIKYATNKAMRAGDAIVDQVIRETVTATVSQAIVAQTKRNSGELKTKKEVRIDKAKEALAKAEKRSPKTETSSTSSNNKTKKYRKSTRSKKTKPKSEKAIKRAKKKEEIKRIKEFRRREKLGATLMR